jgi:methionine synthase I (cobalamin-dependent)
MTSPLLNLLSERVLVGDGAMGTRLQSLVGDRQQCLDSLNLDPAFSEIVAVVHRSYLEAGADFILTNTYGANAVKLGRYSREGQVAKINLHGARLARKCIDQWTPPDLEMESLPNPHRNRFVAGSVGPLEIYSTRDEYTEEQLEEIFDEQIRALVDGGVDLLYLETFQDLFEASVATRVSKQYDLPIFLTVGGVQNGHTGTGADVREFANLANRLGLQAVGCNCRGPYDVLESTKLLAQVTSLPLIAKPNAGSPEIDRGRVAYNVDPIQFRKYAIKLADAGASVIGGCCGTDPNHIQQISDALQGRPAPPRRCVSDVRVFETHHDPRSTRPSQAPNLVQEVFNLPFVVSVEMRPHREKPLDGFLEAGRLLASEGVHLFDVPDNAGARITVDPLYSAAKLQEHTRIPTVMHFSTSHRNLIATQSYLLGCHHAATISRVR